MNFKHRSLPAMNFANAQLCITTGGVQDLVNWMSNGYRIGNLHLVSVIHNITGMEFPVIVMSLLLRNVVSIVL